MDNSSTSLPCDVPTNEDLNESLVCVKEELFVLEDDCQHEVAKEVNNQAVLGMESQNKNTEVDVPRFGEENENKHMEVNALLLGLEDLKNIQEVNHTLSCELQQHHPLTSAMPALDDGPPQPHVLSVANNISLPMLGKTQQSPLEPVNWSQPEMEGRAQETEQGEKRSYDSSSSETEQEEQNSSGSTNSDTEEEYTIPKQEEILFVPCGNHNSSQRKRRKMGHNWTRTIKHKPVINGVTTLCAQTSQNPPLHIDSTDQPERIVGSKNIKVPSFTRISAFVTYGIFEDETAFNNMFLSQVLSLYSRNFTLDLKALLEIALELCNHFNMKPRNSLVLISTINKLIYRTSKFDSIRDDRYLGPVATAADSLVKVATESNQVTEPCFLPKSAEFFFATLQFHLLELGPSRLFCMDHAKLPLQLQEPGDRATLSGKEHTFTTVCCLSASSDSVPPFLLLPKKLDQLSSIQEFGITKASFCDWLQFFVNRSGCSSEQPTVLLVRGDQRFLHSVAAQKLAEKAGLVLLSFPSNLPNSINPLPEFFTKLTDQFRMACARWHDSNSGSRDLELTTVASLYALSFKMVATHPTVSACFEAAGLYPLICLKKMAGFWKLVGQRKQALRHLNGGKVSKTNSALKKTVSSSDEHMLKLYIDRCNQQITAITQSSSSSCQPHPSVLNDQTLDTKADDTANEGDQVQLSSSVASQQPAVAVYRVRLPETSSSRCGRPTARPTKPVPGTIFRGPAPFKLIGGQHPVLPALNTRCTNLVEGSKLTTPSVPSQSSSQPLSRISQIPLSVVADIANNNKGVGSPTDRMFKSDHLTKHVLLKHNQPSTVDTEHSGTAVPEKNCDDNEVLVLKTHVGKPHSNSRGTSVLSGRLINRTCKTPVIGSSSPPRMSQPAHSNFDINTSSESNDRSRNSSNKMNSEAWMNKGSCDLSERNLKPTFKQKPLIPRPLPVTTSTVSSTPSPKASAPGARTKPLRNTARKRTRRNPPTRHLNPEVSCPVCQESTEEEWIQCMHCQAWVHELCADIRDPLVYYCDFCLLKKKEGRLEGGSAGEGLGGPPPSAETTMAFKGPPLALEDMRGLKGPSLNPDGNRGPKPATMVAISEAIEAVIRKTYHGGSDTGHSAEVISGSVSASSNASADTGHGADVRPATVSTTDTNTVSIDICTGAAAMPDGLCHAIIGDVRSLATGDEILANNSCGGLSNETANDVPTTSDQSSRAVATASMNTSTIFRDPIAPSNATTIASLGQTSVATTITSSATI